MECTKSVSMMVFNPLQCNGYANVFAMSTRRHHEASEVKINFGGNGCSRAGRTSRSPENRAAYTYATYKGGT